MSGAMRHVSFPKERRVFLFLGNPIYRAKLTTYVTRTNGRFGLSTRD